MAAIERGRQTHWGSPETKLPFIQGLGLGEFFHVCVRLALVLEAAEVPVLGVLRQLRHLELLPDVIKHGGDSTLQTTNARVSYTIAARHGSNVEHLGHITYQV